MGRALSLCFALLASCGGDPDPGTTPDDTDTGTTTPPVTTPGPTTTLTTTETFDPGFYEGLFCSVRSVFEVGCVTGCHSAIVPEAGLDLHTDPYGAIVGVPSSGTPGATLVVAGDPGGSLLFRKMAGTQLENEGAVMPTQGLMDPVFQVAVRDWIAAGAPDDCQPPPETGTTPTTVATGGEPYHPVGWSSPDQHGYAAKLQTGGDCRSCHGAELDGGAAGRSCDDCHPPGWRTDCDYCHGGTLNTTGAPPKDIDGNTDPATISFRAHPEHVAGLGHPAYGCAQCHDRPTDVLTPGHLFQDYTPGYGEIDYGAGISPIATYYQGTCSNTYCHGNGLEPGSVSDGDGPFTCYGCHPDTTDQGNWNQMSGEHDRHLRRNVRCSECHAQVVDANQTIVGPTYHVNGTPDLQMPISWNGTTCTGSCHNHGHDADSW